MFETHLPLFSRRTTAILLLALLTGPAAMARELTLDVLLQAEANGRSPQHHLWRPGTAELGYLWDDGDGPAWWHIDAVSNETTRIARLSELGIGDGDTYTIHAFSPDGAQLLYSNGGDLFLFDLTHKRQRRLSREGSSAEAPGFSPDGARIAFVRDDELYSLEIASGEERRLTQDGKPGVIFNGITDWVYWEEIWGRSASGYWWSPDSQRLAYYHIDDSDVPIYPLVDMRPLHPEIDPQRYPKAGDPLPVAEVRVVDVATGAMVRLATGDPRDVYLARVHWHPSGEQVAVERLDRQQNRLQILLCDLAGSCRSLLEETWPTWINLGEEFTFLADGSFLWSSEKSGWRRLYLHDSSGAQARALTPEDWVLTSLDSVDAESGRFVYTAYSTAELGAIDRHLFVGHLDGSPPQRLTRDPGWHSALVSPSGYWLHTWSDADTPPTEVLRHLGNALLDHATVIAELPSALPTYDSTALPSWKFLTIEGADGSPLPAMLLEPPDIGPSRKYPVVMYHYGCPASQVVENRWRPRRRRALWHKLMATRGYGIFAVDNRASTFFGKKGEDLMHRRFGELELEAQIAGVEYLKKLPWVDSQRLGIWGWSGGGSSTLYVMFKRPGLWRAGIAGAPVTDWRYYDAIWIERYLDHPRDAASAYKLSSPLSYAENLQDPLLVIHGTADNNVHPQNTYNLIERLMAADRRFDLALYPNERHSLQTFAEASQRDLFRRLTDFFDQHLRNSRSSLR